MSETEKESGLQALERLKEALRKLLQLASDEKLSSLESHSLTEPFEVLCLSADDTPSWRDEVRIRTVAALDFIDSHILNTLDPFPSRIAIFTEHISFWTQRYLLPASPALPSFTTSAQEPDQEALSRFNLLMDELMSYLNTRHGMIFNRAYIQKLLDFEQLYNSIIPRLAEIEKPLQQVQELSQQITALQNSQKEFYSQNERLMAIAKTLEAAEERINHIETIRSKLEDEAKSVHSLYSECTEKSKVIKDLSASAQALTDTLTAEEKDLRRLSQEAETIRKRNLHQSRQIDKLISQIFSHSLTRSYEDKVARLTDSSFYWLIVLFICLAGILWINSDTVSLLQQAWKALATAQGNVFNPFLIILSKFAVCLPFFWGAWFTTRKLNLNYRLKEDYEFKVTTARTYLSYKDEARYVDEKGAPGSMEKRVLDTVINRLNEHPLRIYNDPAASSPLHELISLLRRSGPKGEEAAARLLEVLREIPDSSPTSDIPPAQERGAKGKAP